MAKLIFKSKIEQVAAHLREEMARGRWNKEIPGREELSSELGVNSKTVESALQLLESKGVLIPQGAGRRRKISDLVESALPALHIKLLIYEDTDRSETNTVETIHQLSALGHIVTFSDKSLQELGMNVKRVASYVEKNPADAWVVMSGSREILQWFTEMNLPVFAQFGRCRDIAISGVIVNKAPALTNAVSILISLGHRRIVMLARSERRKPNPGLLERAFLDELERNGIKTGPYHLPDWDDHIEGFHRCLDALFTTTPPTAIFLSEADQMIAAQQHLACKGIIAPRDISLICQDPSNAFSWCIPKISHIYWDSKPVVNSIIQWANRIARGKDTKKQKIVFAEFVEGGTIGPVVNR
jgi:DNA-binding LacI/PurR family transcriptional regulator/biotin operon repressor